MVHLVKNKWQCFVVSCSAICVCIKIIWLLYEEIMMNLSVVSSKPLALKLLMQHIDSGVLQHRADQHRLYPKGPILING